MNKIHYRILKCILFVIYIFLDLISARKIEVVKVVDSFAGNFKMIFSDCRRHASVCVCLNPRFPPKSVMLQRDCNFNPLNTNPRLFYLKTQFVPPSKHFSSLF